MSISEKKPSVESDGQVRHRRRRRWSETLTRQIAAETLEPGVWVLMLAQRYNVNANQVFKWGRLFREPERATGAGRFVPVVVEELSDPRWGRRRSVEQTGWWGL